MPRVRVHLPPLADPARVVDAFANGFDVHDWEDWLRLLCWTDYVEGGGDGGDGGKQLRRLAAEIVMPRSSVPGLIKVLRFSIAQHVEQARHS